MPNDFEPTIKEIKEAVVSLYNGKNELIGSIKSALSFDDVRVQIKENQLKDYYIMFEGEKIFIDEEGNVNHWPNGMYDDLMKFGQILLGG